MKREETQPFAQSCLPSRVGLQNESATDPNIRLEGEIGSDTYIVHRASMDSDRLAGIVEGLFSFRSLQNGMNRGGGREKMVEEETFETCKREEKGCGVRKTTDAWYPETLMSLAH